MHKSKFPKSKNQPKQFENENPAHFENTLKVSQAILPSTVSSIGINLLAAN